MNGDVLLFITVVGVALSQLFQSLQRVDLPVRSSSSSFVDTTTRTHLPKASAQVIVAAAQEVQQIQHVRGRACSEAQRGLVLTTTHLLGPNDGSHG